MLHLESKLWVKGYAISMYSKGYDWVEGQDFTELGQAVHKFKYYTSLSTQDRDKILNFCLIAFKRALEEKFGKEPPFNLIVAAPPNRVGAHSLPPLIAKGLAEQSGGSLVDVGTSLTKVKDVPVLKNLDSTGKAIALSDAYLFKANLPEPRRGILIVDDIYDSGATLRFIARAINVNYPNLPKYVMVLTSLRKNY